MNAKNRLVISLFVIACSQGGRDRAQTGTRLMSLRPSQTWKMMASKPICRRHRLLPKALAEDWTRGDNDGTFYTKAEL